MSMWRSRNRWKLGFLGIRFVTFFSGETMNTWISIETYLDILRPIIDALKPLQDDFFRFYSNTWIQSVGSFFQISVELFFAGEERFRTPCGGWRWVSYSTWKPCSSRPGGYLHSARPSTQRTPKPLQTAPSSGKTQTCTPWTPSWWLLCPSQGIAKPVKRTN